MWFQRPSRPTSPGSFLGTSLLAIYSPGFQPHCLLSARVSCPKCLSNLLFSSQLLFIQDGAQMSPLLRSFFCLLPLTPKNFTPLLLKLLFYCVGDSHAYLVCVPLGYELLYFRNQALVILVTFASNVELYISRCSNVS